nr:hypothetical protein [Methylovulum psychrotolerans]
MDILAEPLPDMFDGHEVGAVGRQRHQGDAQFLRRLSDLAAAVVGGVAPNEGDVVGGGKARPDPPEDFHCRVPVGFGGGEKPHLGAVVEIRPEKRHFRQPRRVGTDPGALAFDRPAVALVG